MVSNAEAFYASLAEPEGNVHLLIS